MLARSILRASPRTFAHIPALMHIPRNSYSSASPHPPPGSRKVKSTLGPDVGNPTNVNQPAFSKSGQLLRVNISEAAVNKLKLLKEEENSPNLALRIKVESGGCHGFQYIFKLQDSNEFNKSDSIFEREDCRVLIDHTSLKILRDATIDYTTELIGSQFKIKSPHTSSSCGCGTSFSLDMED